MWTSSVSKLVVVALLLATSSLSEGGGVSSGKGKDAVDGSTKKKMKTK